MTSYNHPMSASDSDPRQALLAVLQRMEGRMRGRTVSLHLSQMIPPSAIDSPLLETLFACLLEHILEVTRSWGGLRITAQAAPPWAVVEIMGGQLKEGSLEGKIHPARFDSADGDSRLALAAAIVAPNGGRLEIDRQAPQTEVVRVILPLSAPRV